MAFVYLDSSIIISIVLNDPRGSQAQTILGSRNCYTSQISEVECQAGLSYQFSSAPSGLPASEQMLNTILAGMQIAQLTPTIIALMLGPGWMAPFAVIVRGLGYER